MPRKKQVEKGQDARLTKALSTVESQRAALLAQQSELQQLRDVVGQLAAPKPGRPFRGRTLFHGGLDVKLKGTDVTENEVWIEHRGEVLVILVGQAAAAAYSGGPVRVADPARFGASNEVEKQEERRAPLAVHRPQVDLQELELQRVGLGSLDAASPFGQQLASVFTDDGRPVVNAAVAPQSDPRQPGGWQDRTEAAEIAQRFGGYDGRGPKPAGWVDPDAQPS